MTGELVAALDRLIRAVERRETISGDVSSLLDAKAEIRAAAEQGKAAIAKARGGAS